MKIDQELGDKSGVSKSLHGLGWLAQETGEYDEARKLYQQSLKIKQELGDKSGVSKSLHRLGALAQATGEYDEARKLYQQSLKIKQELGDKSGVSISLHKLGHAGQRMGEYEEARKLYQQSLKIKQELGDKSGMALSQAQWLCWKRKWEIKGGLAADSPGRGSLPGTGEPLCKTCTRGPGEAGEKSMRQESYHAENLMQQ